VVPAITTEENQDEKDGKDDPEELHQSWMTPRDARRRMTKEPMQQRATRSAGTMYLLSDKVLVSGFVYRERIA
jgi:hypothetical protein